MEAGNSSICTEDAFPPGSLEVGVINSPNFRSQELLDSCYVYLFCLATHQRLRQNKLGSLHSVKQHYQSVETTRRMENGDGGWRTRNCGEEADWRERIRVLPLSSTGRIKKGCLALSSEHPSDDDPA